MKSLMIICVVASALALMGCKGSEQSVHVAKNYTKQPVAYQKPGAAIALSDSLVKLEVEGAPYSINIDINSQYSNGDMELSVSTSDGLYITSGDENPTVALSKGVIAFPYTITAIERGRFYIYINAVIEADGNKEARALTFIVQVGEENKAATDSPAQKSESNKDLVIPMQAKEEIIR